MANVKLEDSISMINLPQQYRQQQTEINQAIAQVLQKGNFINGQQVTQFEQQLATHLQISHVVSCANGTDALQLALMTLGIGHGDEVIIPAFAYVSVAEVIVLLGAIPVFVDIECEYFFIDVEKVKKAITPKTKAIIAVHLFGQTGNLGGLIDIAVENNLFLIEDTAQALGASYTINHETNFLGSWGHLGCTSFFPTKNLGCFGDGGALFTSLAKFETKTRIIASHGQTVKYQHDLVGINSRLDTLQAAILQVRLKYLNTQKVAKEAVYEQYCNGLKNVDFIILPKRNPLCQPAWHQFTIQVKTRNRDKLKTYLAKNKIPTMVYYHIPLTSQTAYRQYSSQKVNFSVALQMANTVLSLPIHPGLTSKQVSFIIATIKKFENE